MAKQKVITSNSTPLILSGQVPYSQEAEEAVLGAVLVNPEVASQVAKFLNPEDFYILRHTYIWQAILDIRSRGGTVDYLTVAEELRSQGRLTEVGGPAYLTNLMNSMPTSMHAEVYGRIVERAAIRRYLMAAADEIKTWALDEEIPLERVVQQSDQALFQPIARFTMNTRETMFDAITNYFNRISEASRNPDEVMGLPSGLRDLDKQLNGFIRGLVYVFAAVPGMGKTDLLLNFLAASIGFGASVLFLSLELERWRVLNKLTSIMTGVEHARLLQGKLTSNEWEKVARALASVSRPGVEIEDFNDQETSLDNIKTFVDAWRDRYGLDLLLIDYAGLITTGQNKSEYEEGVYGIKNLRKMARRWNVPVVAAAQFNEFTVNSRQNKRPQMSDLRYGGVREIDVLGGIYFDNFYSPHGRVQSQPGIAEIHLLKNRDAPRSIVEVFRDGAIAKFSDRSPNARVSSPPVQHYLDELDDRAYGETEDDE
jgi:replicative DNA helicase